jgi:hypothetical protein
VEKMRFLLLIVVFSAVLLSDTLGSREVNRLRRASGMAPLKYSFVLARAAHNHAKYLARLRLTSHTESPKYPYFTGRTPFDRIAKAGFGSRVGVENISFAESSYEKSVEVLFSTIYHRLAFLDFRIDSIGTSAYGNRKGRVYVYDMASSKVSQICKKRYKNSKGKFIYGVCAKKDRKIPLIVMKRALREVERRSKKVVTFPYSGALVGSKFINETPNPFRRRVNMGFPVTVSLNPAYFGWAKIKKFRIFDGSKRVKAKLITSKNDIRRKISPLTFVLVPLKPLKSQTSYKVVFEASTSRGKVEREWHFMVK